jgi:hypothetical protein
MDGTPSSDSDTNKTVDHSTPGWDAGPLTTAAYLEEVATKILEAHNTFDDPDSIQFIRDHTSEGLEILQGTTAHEGPVSPCESLDEYISNMRALKEVYPAFHVFVGTVSAQVGKDGTHAVVWAMTAGSRMRDDKGFNRESVSLMYFKRRTRDGVWLWYKHNSLRGTVRSSR